MAFIRLKKSKGNTYASLVKSVYNSEYQDKKEVVLKNLGRVYEVNSSTSLSFAEYLLRYHSLSISDILSQLDFVHFMNLLIEYYLFTFNFCPIKNLDSSLEHKQLFKSLQKKKYSCSFFCNVDESLFVLYDVENHSFVDSRFFRDCTLKHGRGYFNTHTISSLFTYENEIFRKSINFDDQVKHIFISRLISCGIFVEPQYLVLLYNKFSEYFKKNYLSSLQYVEDSLSESESELLTDTSILDLKQAIENTKDSLNEPEDDISKKDFISQFL